MTRVRINGTLVPSAGTDRFRIKTPIDELGRKVGTAMCTLEDRDLTLGLTPREGDLVEILDDELVHLEFSGHITQLTRRSLPIGRAYDVVASDWMYVLDKIMCDETSFSAGLTDAWLAATTWEQFGDPIVGSGITWDYIIPSVYGLPAQAFPRQTLRQRFDAIAALSGGALYWIDPEQQLHWNDVGTLAPYAVSTQPNEQTDSFRTYREEVLSDSPTAYYRLGETSGTVARDETGNGHDGTYVGSPTLGVAGAVDDGDPAVALETAGMYVQEKATDSISAVFTMTLDGGNDYVYTSIDGAPSFTLAAGDRIKYDVFWNEATSKIALDLNGSGAGGWAFRDAGAVDQNGIPAHTNTDLSAYALNRWYSRDIAVPASLYGKTSAEWNIVCEQDAAGTYKGQLRNIRIVDSAGVVKAAVTIDGSLSGTTIVVSSLTDTWALTPSSVVALGTDAFSVEAWVYLSAHPTANAVIYSNETPSGTRYGYTLYLAGTVDWAVSESFFVCERWHDGGVSSINTSGVQKCLLGQWMHVVVTYDGAALRISADLASPSSVATASPIPPYATQGDIGKHVLGTAPLLGRADEVALYDHALSPERIAAHYAAAQVRLAGFSDFEDYRDRTQRIERVTYNIGEANEAVATDWVLHARNDRVRGYENASPDLGAGSSTTRFLARERTDVSLSAAEGLRLGYTELAAQGDGRTISFTVTRSGLKAGQVIDIVHSTWANADRGPYVRSCSGRRPLQSRAARRVAQQDKTHGLYGSLGRFVIQQVTPEVRPDGLTHYRVQCGTYESSLPVLLARNL